MKAEIEYDGYVFEKRIYLSAQQYWKEKKQNVSIS